MQQQHTPAAATHGGNMQRPGSAVDGDCICKNAYAGCSHESLPQPLLLRCLRRRRCRSAAHVPRAVGNFINTELFVFVRFSAACLCICIFQFVFCWRRFSRLVTVAPISRSLLDCVGTFGRSASFGFAISGFRCFGISYYDSGRNRVRQPAIEHYHYHTAKGICPTTRPCVFLLLWHNLPIGYIQ